MTLHSKRCMKYSIWDRMEIYCKPKVADDNINIKKAFDVDAKIIGKGKKSVKKSLIIESEESVIEY